MIKLLETFYGLKGAQDYAEDKVVCKPAKPVRFLYAILVIQVPACMYTVHCKLDPY